MSTPASATLVIHASIPHTQDDEIAAIAKVIQNSFNTHDGPFAMVGAMKEDKDEAVLCSIIYFQTMLVVYNF